MPGIRPPPTQWGDYNLTNVIVSRSKSQASRRSSSPIVILHVQDVLTLDFELPVRSLSDTVEAGAALLNTASGAVGTVVDRTFV